MAGINRFYKPSRSKYVSQFVPDQLPADLMLKGLAAKQGKYNQMDATLTKFGEWDQRALKGRDTEYVEEKKKGLSDFIDKSMTQDLGSQEFAREYQSFKKGFQEDKGLKKVASSVAIQDEFQERVKKLKEGKGTDYDQAFVDDYNRHYAQYTADTTAGGRGFEGDVQLSDPSILEGVDINSEYEKFYDQLKADGHESIASIGGGLSYKNGWKSLDGKVDEQTARIMDLAYNNRAGQQLRVGYDATHIPAGMTYDQFRQNASPEAVQEHENGKHQYVADVLSRVGQGFKFQDTTTNKDVALRQQHGNDREDAILNPQSPNFEVFNDTYAIKTPDFDESTVNFEKNVEAIATHTEVRDVYSQVIDSMNGATFSPSPEERKLLTGIPGAEKFLNGAPLTEVEAGNLKDHLTNKIKSHDYQINSIKVQQTEIKNKSINTTEKFITELNGGKPRTYGEKDLSLSEAIDLGNNFKDNPELAEIMQDTQRRAANGQLPDPYYEYAESSDPKVIKKLETYQKHKKDIDTWLEATQDYETVADNVANSYSPAASKYKEIYNTEQSYQSVGQVIDQKTTTYKPRTLDAQGRVINSTSNVRTADNVMNGLYKTNSGAFDVMVNGHVITPDDPRYQTDIDFGAAGKETYNGKPVFFASKEVEVDDPWTGDKVKETVNYTIVAKDLTNIDNYYQAKKNESYSNVLADPSYDPRYSPSKQPNLSQAGQQSALDMTTYNDPKLAEQMSRATGLKSPGQKIFFTRNGFNPATGQNEPINYQVTKSGGNEGQLLLQVTDKDGNYIVGNKHQKTISANNPGHLSGEITGIEESLQERAEKYRRGEIGLTTPINEQAGFDQEGSYTADSNLEGNNYISPAAAPTTAEKEESIRQAKVVSVLTSSYSFKESAKGLPSDNTVLPKKELLNTNFNR